MIRNHVPRMFARAAAVSVVAMVAAPLAVTLPSTASATVSATGSYVVVSAPPQVSAGATALFAIGMRNASTVRIGSFRVAVPRGFIPRLPLGLAITPRGLWSLTLKTCTAPTPAPCSGAGAQVIQADARRSDGADRLSYGDVVIFAFQAKAPVVGGIYPWRSAAAAVRGFTGTPSVATGPTPTVTVLSTAAASLRIAGLPTGPVTAGTPLSMTVSAVDVFGNPASGYRGTVHFSLGAANQPVAPVTSISGSSVPGDYTFTAGDAGVHIFSGLVLTSVPAQTVTATDQANGLTSAASTVSVTAAVASSLLLTTPSATPAGVPLLAGVTASDAYGNIATGYLGTIHLSVTDGSAGEPLPGDYTFVGADQGTHPLTVTLTRAGSRTLTVSAGPLQSSAPTTVTPAPASKLTLTPETATVQAGTPFGATLAVKDAYDNVIPDYVGTVHFGALVGATLPGPFTFQVSDGGAHTFAGLKLTEAVSTVLTVTDGSLSASAQVDVSAAPADHLTIDGANPAAATAGASVPLLLSARDAYGNIDPTYDAPVVFQCLGAGTGGSCPAASTFAGGRSSAAAVFTAAGADTAAATSGVLPSVVLSVNVSHALAAALSLTTAPPASVVAGAGFGLTVSVVDGYGNLVSDYPASTVTLAANPAASPFPVSAQTSGGLATFSGVRVTKAGGYTLTVGSLPLSDTGAAVTVTPDVAAQLVLTAPASVTAGVPFAAQVWVVDQYNNLVPTSTGLPVTLGAAPSAGSLPVAANTAAGVASFPAVTLTTAAATALTATGGSLIPGAATVAVAAGAPATILVNGVLDQGSAPRLPHPVVGQLFDTTLSFRDGFGNLAPVGPGVTVTLTRSAGTGALAGITTNVPVPPGASQLTVVGSTYSVLENAVGITATASGLSPSPTPGSITVDVAGQAVTAQASPNVPLPPLKSVDPVNGQPCVVGPTQATCSEFVLQNGASSADPVFLYQTVCANASGATGITCKTSGNLQAQLVYATATLKDAAGNPLYSRANPATLIVRCYVTVCKHPDESPGEAQEEHGHELAEDVAANPLEVTVYLTGPTPGSVLSITGDATVCAVSGAVDANKYFCLDPVLSGRDGSGNYIQNLKFFGDPLAHNH